jgi:hypothetical protein
VKDFTIEDFRILIGQNISLNVLMPLAIGRLKQNIMAEGDLYPGDLLQTVLNAETFYWLKNAVVHRRLSSLYRHNLTSIEKRVGKSITKDIFKSITQSFEKFSKINFS